MDYKQKVSMYRVYATYSKKGRYLCMSMLLVQELFISRGNLVIDPNIGDGIYLTFTSTK